MPFTYRKILLYTFSVCHGCMGGKIPAFLSGIPGFIPGMVVRDFNFYRGTGCIAYVFCLVLSLVVVLTFS